jgi:hypothetical protein
MQQGIEKVWIGWKNCRASFPNGNIELFSTGGGSYMDFSYHSYWHTSIHFYFLGYCYFSISFIQKG